MIGLRTLILAEREIDEAKYTRWSKMFKDAENLIEEREEQMEKVSAMIE